jgi:hypothetical protein
LAKGAASPKQEPKVLAERDLPLLVKDGSLRQAAPELANEGGGFAAGVAAIGASEGVNRNSAVGAGCGIWWNRSMGIRLTSGDSLHQQEEYRPRLIFHRSPVWVSRWETTD